MSETETPVSPLPDLAQVTADRDKAYRELAEVIGQVFGAGGVQLNALGLFVHVQQLQIALDVLLETLLAGKTLDRAQFMSHCAIVAEQAAKNFRQQLILAGQVSGSAARLTPRTQ